MEVEHHKFEEALQAKKDSRGVKFDTELTAEDLKELVEDYKKIIKDSKGKSFPEDPRKQLTMSIDAVLGSWNNKRAIAYRNLHDIPHNIGTAVNVQTNKLTGKILYRFFDVAKTTYAAYNRLITCLIKMAQDFGQLLLLSAKSQRHATI